MPGERPGLRLAGGEDPVWRLWSQMPVPWRGPVIGDGIGDWTSITENTDYRINLTGLPGVIQAELAWMARWQAADGTRSSVLAISQLANILRRAISEGHPFPASIRQMDWDDAAALQSWFYASRWGRFPPHGPRARLRVIFRFARTALIAACHDGHWWELDYWHPRCDGRIPLTEREPQAHYGCSPALIACPWLREAAKWYLGTILESGALRWSTVSQERLPCLHRFDRWLAAAFDDPREVLAGPAAAARQAAAFRRWAADPANRSDPGRPRRGPAKVHPRLVNDDLRSVAELLAFMASHQAEAGRVLGPLAAPWAAVTDAHAACWMRQVSRIPHTRVLNEANYVDDHALAQITAALPLLGLPRGEQMPLTRGGGGQVSAAGFGDPQAMRMILLQILTGRRSSEIRHCEERELVLEALDSDRLADKSPAQAWAVLLDEGRYHCSIRTMYRVLASRDEVRDRRAQAAHPPRVRPELVADGPDQVWTWDIVRHEALWNRVEVRDLRRLAVAAAG